MMKNEMVYSFVMPVFKAKYLKQAVDSILNQTFSSWELIVVNDASPENIKDIIAQYNDLRISYYVNKENIGSKNLVLSWNKCLRYAKGEYLILASDDDVYDENFIMDVDKCVKRYPTVDLLRARVQRITSKGEVTDFDQFYKEYMAQAEFVFFWSKGLIGCISNYVFRREALMKQGGFIDFPCAWFSDDATIIRMAKKGVVSTKEVLFSFRNSDISISWTFNVDVLKRKWKATGDFYCWFEKEYMLLDSEDAYIDVYRHNAIFNVRNKVKKMYSQLLREMPVNKTGYILKSLYKNQFLYKKEKIHLLIDFLLK